LDILGFRSKTVQARRLCSECASSILFPCRAGYLSYSFQKLSFAQFESGLAPRNSAVELNDGQLTFVLNAKIQQELPPSFARSPESTSLAIRLHLCLVLGKRAEPASERNFREAIEKICATATAVSLGRTERYSPSEENIRVRRFQIACSRRMRQKRAHNGAALIQQLHERVVALALTKSHAAVACARCAARPSGTDQSWAGRLGKRQLFWLPIPNWSMHL
jgi:hypothetical protein